MRGLRSKLGCYIGKAVEKPNTQGLIRVTSAISHHSANASAAAGAAKAVRSLSFPVMGSQSLFYQRSTTGCVSSFKLNFNAATITIEEYFVWKWRGEYVQRMNGMRIRDGTSIPKTDLLFSDLLYLGLWPEETH